MSEVQCNFVSSHQDFQNLYFVMDYAPGGDLLGVLNRDAPLSEGHIRFYLAEIAMAIHAVHQLGYVHRYVFPVVKFITLCHDNSQRTSHELQSAELVRFVIYECSKFNCHVNVSLQSEVALDIRLFLSRGQNPGVFPLHSYFHESSLLLVFIQWTCHFWVTWKKFDNVALSFRRSYKSTFQRNNTGPHYLAFRVFFFWALSIF